MTRERERGREGEEVLGKLEDAVCAAQKSVIELLSWLRVSSSSPPIRL